MWQNQRGDLFKSFINMRWMGCVARSPEDQARLASGRHWASNISETTVTLMTSHFWPLLLSSTLFGGLSRLIEAEDNRETLHRATCFSSTNVFTGWRCLLRWKLQCLACQMQLQARTEDLVISSCRHRTGGPRCVANRWPNGTLSLA